MTPEQRKLAWELVVSPDGLHQVAPQDFAQRFPSALSGDRLALSLLEDAACAQDGADLQAVLIVGATFGFTSDHVPLLCQLLRDDWHCAHEDIISTLQDLRDPRAVDALHDAALVSHAYLAHDEFFGLARKCTWALADIGTAQARAKLEMLAACSNPLIAQYAQKRIDNWLNERHRKAA